jgi:hypothetical protein
MRTFLCGAVVALAAGLAAQAQAGGQPVNPINPAAPPNTTVPSTTPPAATAPPAADTTATTSAFSTGMTVKDAQGQTIGTIDRVIKTPDGATTVAVKVDGRRVNLPGSTLSVSPTGGAVSTMTKAQITASTAPPS